MSVFEFVTMWALTCLVLVFNGMHTSVAMVQDDDESVKAHWALLVAGSYGWGNYRHQADVAHAYQALKQGGFNPDHIVVMMADDVANADANPYPGQLFNCPGCADVYAGLSVDYRGVDVTAANVLSVLRGDRMDGVGSGRTIGSSANDRVFFFYSDHGATGFVGMPIGPPLFAHELTTALEEKHRAGGFKELVVFLEACESGSMFQGLLGSDIPVFATTASNTSESSWATYCPDWRAGASVKGSHTPEDIGTCLGDLYSVSWVEMAETVDLQKWSLQNQFKAIRTRTSANYTYHWEYGAMLISHEPSSDFEGSHAAVTAVAHANGRSTVSLPQHEADLAHLHWRAAAGAGSTAAKAVQELEAAQRERAAVDSRVRTAVGTVLLRHMPAAQQQLKALSGPHGETGVPAEALEEHARLWMAAAEVREVDQPVVDSWECLKEYVEHYEQHCGRLTTYAARHSASMARLCNAGVPPASWSAALAIACQ